MVELARRRPLDADAAANGEATRQEENAAQDTFDHAGACFAGQRYSISTGHDWQSSVEVSCGICADFDSDTDNALDAQPPFNLDVRLSDDCINMR